MPDLAMERIRLLFSWPRSTDGSWDSSFLFVDFRHKSLLLLLGACGKLFFEMQILPEFELGSYASWRVP